jgi:arylsulfatase A-like enzyme
MDEQIKRVFDYLKEIGEYDNTMILFFSDNGATAIRKRPIRVKPMSI